jgi:hypothetical protein
MPRPKAITTLVPGKRTRTIGGETVTIAMIPSRASILLMRRVKERGLQGETLTMEDTVEIVSMICMRSNPKITETFLLDNTELPDLSEFIVWVLEPLNKTKEEVEQKNFHGVTANPETLKA